MSKKQNSTLAYVLLGVAAYMFLRPQQVATNYSPQFAQVPPPPPPSNAQAFAQWANAMFSIYGNVATLWQPGGPFYQFPTNDIYDTVNTNPIPDYNNPYVSETGGWA